MQVLYASKPLFLILNSIFLLISAVTIALTGGLPTWIAGIVALGLTLYANNLGNLKNLGRSVR